MVFLRVVFHLIVEYFLLLPYLLLAGILLSHPYSIWMWLASFLLANLNGVILGIIFPKQKWWLSGLLIMVTGLFMGYQMGDQWVTWLSLALLYPFFIYRGMRHIISLSVDILSVPLLFVGGFLTYFISYLVFRYIAELSSYLPIITFGGVIFVIGTLFISNSEQLKRSILSTDVAPSVSQTMKRQNKLYLSLTVGLILVLTFGRFIQNGFLNVIRWLFQLLAGDGESEQIPVEPPGGSTDMPGLLLDEIQEPSAIAVFLEKIMIYAVYLFLAVGALFLLLMLMKKTRGWIMKLLGFMYHFLKKLGDRFAADEDAPPYEDEKENIFDFNDWKEDHKNRLKSLASKVWKRKIKWQDLSNREKVRFVYRHFILEQASDKIKSDTVRETVAKLPQQTSLDPDKIKTLRTAYENVRYGDQDITDAQVEAIHDLIKQK